LLEDGVAVLGLFLASAGITASYVTGSPLWDALASIAVGLMLGVVAVFLVFENRAQLLGRAVPPDIAAKFESIVRAWPGVRVVRDVKTRQLTPESYLFKAEIQFDARVLTQRLDALVPKRSGDSEHDRRLMLETIAEMALQSIGAEIDAIEQAIRAAIPEARHIDLEIDKGASLASAKHAPATL
jgi:solute carrier family 30 (zinc transporter), member 9